MMVTMEMVEKLKARTDYEFECNLSKEYKGKETDEWGCAFVWVNDGDFGVEYNFCMDEGENYCAIYKTVINEKTDYMETDTSSYIHYDIDFDNPEWEKELENAMCKALIEFFEM